MDKRLILGVGVTPATTSEVASEVTRAARDRCALGVTALAVHGVMTGVLDRRQRARLNDLEIVAPDGQPVRWALNLLYRVRLRKQVRGADLTRAVLSRAEAEGLSVFFYGSTEAVLSAARASVLQTYPRLQIAGTRPSLFTVVDEAGRRKLADELRASGADLYFVGLGCPRQEVFVHAMRKQLSRPMIAVGAAFDYLAGTLGEPPAFIQRHGLEWAWRLVAEPRRLWRRYVLLNPAYVALVAAQWLRFHTVDPIAGGESPEWLPV